MGKRERSKWLRPWPAYLIVFTIGVLGTSWFWSFRLNREMQNLAAEIKPYRQANNPYQYINPLLGYEVPGNIKEFNEYTSLDNAIQKTVSDEGSNAPDAYGVYFRDLSLGRWVGVNQDGTFAPGSLMKVVLMIAYFKEAEADPSVLGQQLTYTPVVADQLNGIPFETPSNLTVGNTYSVEQLIAAMIENSDNGAKNALLDHMNPKILGNITTDLGISYLDTTKNYDAYTITPKQYAVILRVLYNATYLSRAYSEKALGIMTKANYSAGIVAGVPQGTMVAQKYGEAVDEFTYLKTPEITLSNCGIVYYPGHPYMLCVMTRGPVYNNLAQTISTISKLTWSAVDAYAKHGT